MVLNNLQLQQISDEYYVKGYVLGRDLLYEHMRNTYNATALVIDTFQSRDDIMEWLKYQPVHTMHQRNLKQKKIGSFKPQYPFHSFSIDLIDYSKNGSVYTDPQTNITHTYFYILIIIDNYSRFMWAIPMNNKTSVVVAFHFQNWYITHYNAQYIAPPAFFQMDNGGEFIMTDLFITNLPCAVIRSIPRVPQSNALVERSIGTLKRILTKLIHIRHQGYIGIQGDTIHGINSTKNRVLWQTWHHELDRGVSIYNNKKNATTQEKPINAISNYGVVPINIRTRAVINGIQREGDQNSLPLGSFVRKFEHKSGISKHDKNNWSQQVYRIINRRNVNTQDRPTRYTIQKLNPNQTGVNFGTVDPNTPPYNHSLYRELLNQVFI